MSRAPRPAGRDVGRDEAAKDLFGDGVGRGDLESRLTGVAGARDAHLDAVVVKALDAKASDLAESRVDQRGLRARVRPLDGEHAALER